MLELERRTMKMQLQSMSAKGFIIIFSSFIFIFLLAVFIGGVGPYVFSFKSLSTWECPPDVTTYNSATCSGVNLAEGSYWVGEIRHLDKLNQRLSFTVTLWNKNYYIESIKRTIPFNVTIKGRRSNGDWRTITESEVTHKDISCSSWLQYCDNATIATIPFIDYDTYLFNVSIVNPPTEILGNIWFTFTYFHHSFTLFELWFRFIFLIATFMVLLLFVWNLREYAWSEWLIEQRWAAVLLFGLIAYNNPFFPFEILVEGWFPVFVDQLFIASFLFLLLLFWLVMIDGIRRYQPSQRSWRSFYLPKFLLVGGFWLLVVIVFSYQEYSNLDDPEAESILDLKSYVFFFVLFIMFVLAYISWLGYLFVRALSQDNKSLPYLGKRIYFFGFFTIFVIFMVIVGIIFGMIGPIHNNAAELLSYTALLNLYIYVLSVVYLPTQQASQEDDPRKMIGMVRLEGSGSGYGGGAAYLEAMEASGREDDEEEEEDDDGGLERRAARNGGGVESRAAGVGMVDSDSGGDGSTHHPVPSEGERS